MATFKTASGEYNLICPNCNTTHGFSIEALVYVHIPPRGEISSYYTDGDSRCSCNTCHFESTVKTFHFPLEPSQ